MPWSDSKGYRLCLMADNATTESERSAGRFIAGAALLVLGLIIAGYALS
jgi:hypothetical protein